MRLLLALVLAVALWIPDGADEGRQGNELFRNGQYAEAITAYRQGLARMTADPSSIRAGLYNNLGAAQYQLENYAEATRAFRDGLDVTTTTEGRTRLAYNAGNSTFREEKLEEALAHYREALLANPDHENAKFNYEFVKRRLEERQNEQGNSENSEDEEQQDQQNQNDSNDQQDQQEQNQNDRQNEGNESSQNDRQNSQNQQEQQEEQEQQNSQSQQNEQDQQQDQQGSSGSPNDNASNENSSAQADQQPSDVENQETMSREEALRILQALQNSEEDLLRRMPRQQRSQDRNVEKDW